MGWRVITIRAMIPAVLLANLASAAEMPSGIFRGKLAAIEGSATSGQLSAQDPAGAAYSCDYDARSYFELDKTRVSVTRLAPGDSIEVLADRKPGTRNCYARIVHLQAVVLSRRTAPTPARPVRASDFLPQRGDRTFAGIVLRREGSWLTLKTRAGERTLLIRSDTRFLNEGAKLDATALPVNTHVFVRAGRNSSGEMEAFQVMWGELVNPR